MDSSRLRVTGIDRDKVLKHFRENSFDKNVIDLIVDIKYITVKIDKLKKTGYHVTIMQETKEADDIRSYFIDRFRRRFSKINLKNKFTFIDYTNGICKGEDVSMITFYYRYNLFEKKIFF